MTEADIEREILTMAREGNPWAKIWRAMQRGTGLHLSAADIDRLALDDAIATVALATAERRLETREL